MEITSLHTANWTGDCLWCGSLGVWITLPVVLIWHLVTYFHFSGPHKDHLGWQVIYSRCQGEAWTTDTWHWFVLDQDISLGAILQWDTCLNINDDCVHVQCVHQNQDTLHGIRMFVMIFILTFLFIIFFLFCLPWAWLKLVVTSYQHLNGSVI
jgi:hypothetical protein